jgi:hypothetical protein
MPIGKPWQEMNGADPRQIPGTVGVYELGDDDGNVIYIGYAGGRSLMGLRGAILSHADGREASLSQARRFRYEVTTNYLIRRLELLARYAEDEGELPSANAASDEWLPPLPRYHWKSTGNDAS